MTAAFRMVSAKDTLPDMRIAIVAITAGGARLGRQLGAHLPDSQLYISQRYASLASDDGSSFEPTDLKNLIISLWRLYDGLVLIMATGIVVRIIAPLLESKETDPAVVTMDDAGRFAIALLSGHLGGANELAENCSSVSGACAVITTATDANGLPSFDMLAKEQGWIIEDLVRVKTLNSLLLDGKEIAVVDPTGHTISWIHGRGTITYFDSFAEAEGSSACGYVFVTNRSLQNQTSAEKTLILRPRNLVLGIGCNRGTSADEIEAFVIAHLNDLSLSPKSVHCIASVAAKSDEAGLVDFAKRLGVPLRCFESTELSLVSFPSPPSEHALAAVGVAGVAEPAALLASGNGRLLLNKVKSANVTLAVAEMNEG
jgi:cobalt-precorrin 5A hydrolase